MNTSFSSNITVASNVWINAEDPDATTAYQAVPQIPGDLMVDFIAKENPLLNPRDMRILRDYLTREQLREFQARRFFFNVGEEGAAFESS